MAQGTVQVGRIAPAWTVCESGSHQHAMMQTGMIDQGSSGMIDYCG